MALSVVDLYRDILPKTNCKECNFPTCLAFASMVVSEKLPLNNCPHIDKETLKNCNIELEAQYAEGKWLKRDMKEDSLLWAKEKAASMKLEDLPARIGGELQKKDNETVLVLPYFDTKVFIGENDIKKESEPLLTRYEKVLIYIHMAQGGLAVPTGVWKGLVEFPNTISKIKSMRDGVEVPLINKFGGKKELFLAAGKKAGGKNISEQVKSTDAALDFLPLPKVPVRIVFWDEVEEDGIEAEIKFLFDETITQHLDIESIMFLSEQLKDRLCESAG